MTLPDNLRFSQASLQDFVDCRRRFQLRYLERVSWPALESQPALENERHMEQGLRFHRLAQQHILGVPEVRLTGLSKDEDLTRWWENFLAHAPADIEGKRYPEISLTAPLGSHRLYAKYDLIVIQEDGKALIFDWKTNRRRPKKDWLEKRLQTRVYPYLLVEAGGNLPQVDVTIEPQNVEMVYWFAEFPDRPERIPYTAKQHQEDSQYLASLVSQIESLAGGDFPLTENEDRCRFCVYRSLCNRGVEAGPWEEMEAEGEEIDIELDFEQIVEIEF